MFKRILTFFLFFILVSFNVSSLFDSKSIKYTDDIKGKNSSFEVDVKIKNKDIFVEKKTQDASATSIYSEKYLLKEYNYISKDLEYSMKIDKNKLICHGKNKGNPKSRWHLLKNDIWVQDFNFGFNNFLKSTKRKFEFVLINPNDFTLNEMVAVKEGKNLLKINTREIKTQKIKVTLRGFKSMFWKAEIWYDIVDQKLVKYISNEGPGTATITTTINLK